ncbi:valyl-tRNA synthetase [Saccharopolyspora erythraea NRRL 2338]|uniref:Valine--tRNA ligase n=2 Tax=Saccharopolyspora erythraea TaxID=1836 RepID=A4F9I1_SACEN|nr:valine--tRNA ligase [Saccharopolyspora erythraea]EQD87354.1 valyl-tRNA synthetase [Saccharopolyspora erythraea D]PFG94493.1 valyl-tRNA synthetase [Saccharopolyspora erythraea NRRL 2338]QRK91247.1 valine--tRNA ligase [Saccharopolyspora erythraea]CAM00706.1 valyl-tRNA synthetase [Saccharopolyspora erythraea NRRL 2338]
MTQTHAAQPRELPSTWNPADVEAELYQRWVAAGYFTADPAGDKPPFSIVIPPPNVTGSLHIGHAFEHTLMDVLTRRRRMQGYDALWLPGMDHASIAVQAMVEKQLRDEGIDHRELGREGFLARVWEWKEKHGGAILSQMRRLGDSVDWTRERFTMDDGLSRAVQTIFKKLYDDGLIYRAERLVNWSPEMRSAISDIEVEHKEVEGELVSMRYGHGDASIVVATTRVETMLGDTAVAVHPDDDRYRHLVGTSIELPLTGRMIPIVADTHVDPEFGSGAVKVTPAHDPNDFEIGQRHDLPMLTVMDERGRITRTGTRFDGMDRFEARVAVREALREEGRIVAEKRPYVHSVGHSSRSKEPIEPRLSLQWYVKVGPLAKAAGDAVRDGRVEVHPPEMAKRYFDWVDNLHDWNISRQLWWGHRIPVWYGPGGEVVCVGPDEEPPSGEGWHQDEDVLDTWFSSGLWPFSTMGWPDDTADLRKYYPTSVLVTGYDILFFWVARMMMMGLYAMDGEPPFRVIALHGMVRDPHGKKMSKSAGNTVDPLEWMDNYGTDALRFTLARGANPGADSPISEEWVAGSRSFCTKLFNATKFAMMNGARVPAALPPRDELTDADRWILDRADRVVSEVDELLEDFQFAKATEALYHFTWDEFCDWYLELSKVQLDEQGDRAERTRDVLGHVLDVLLRLLHPTIPYITETLWTTLTGRDSVVVAEWPGAEGLQADTGAAERVEATQKLITEIRRFRSDQGLKPGQRVAAKLGGVSELGLDGHVPAVRALARVTEPADGFTSSASIEVGLRGGTVTVELDLSGAIDVAAERKRLAKDLAAAEKELAGTEKKLGNPAFTDKAPAEVVDKIKVRRDTALADIERINARLSALPES